MKTRLLIVITVILLAAAMLPVNSFAKSDPENGDWSQKNAVLENTAEAELVIRVGDIDACNDEYAVSENGYNPFSAKDQYAHGYPWLKDDTDPDGTDRIYVGSKWKGESDDGYSENYQDYHEGSDTENAYGDGVLKLTMNYSLSGKKIQSVILQLCIDDFQAISRESNFTVTLNGKDAPFIAELLNHADQTGPTSYIVSAIIPSGFFEDIASGKLEIAIDETTGKGDGYAIDFAKLLINYNEKVFTGTFSGYTEPGATVRLLGTSTTVTASSDGKFTFNAIPGINAVRASKKGYKENYDFGIVLSSGTEWEANVPLDEGTGTPDIDFSKFGITSASESDGTSSHSGSTNETDSSNTDTSGKKSKCRVCGICPFQPLGICLFIWIAIILAILIIAVIIIKKLRKKEDDKDGKK